MSLERVRKSIQKICHVLELAAALLVLVGILFSMVNLITDSGMFLSLFRESDAFMHYLEQIFSIVIGIEFLQMLCGPTSDNVIEILIFLVARHMIVGATTPYQDFVSVISVALLCLVRRYLRVSKEHGGLLSVTQKKKEKKEE